MTRRALAAAVLLLVAPGLALADPPPDYQPPTAIPGGPFFQIHRFDLEGLVADRQQLARCQVASATCKQDLAECTAYRVRDAANPNADLWPLWVRVALYAAGGAAAVAAGKLADDWLLD